MMRSQETSATASPQMSSKTARPIRPKAANNVKQDHLLDRLESTQHQQQRLLKELMSASESYVNDIKTDRTIIMNRAEEDPHPVEATTKKVSQRKTRENTEQYHKCYFASSRLRPDHTVKEHMMRLVEVVKEYNNEHSRQGSLFRKSRPSIFYTLARETGLEPVWLKEQSSTDPVTLNINRTSDCKITSYKGKKPASGLSASLSS
ncbi:hypothetical protein CHS0354_017091 [Potamilus streckersoni]|uniref:Uncharacterized protein n=1 Tax=Potamilus streckersoni TaxID=2493646 RepID=A0AAE0VU64_9BIVA|nr:hypothetical protein CHS0354_017091 [Potamilus streckersoni]